MKSYLAATSGSGDDFIGQNYVDPKSVKLTFPDKKRNVIYIYLESLEMTFADEKSGGAFDKNVIPELTELSKEGGGFLRK